MSSVTSHQEDTECESDLVCMLQGLGRREVADDELCKPDPVSTHAGLLGFYWIRAEVEHILQQRKRSFQPIYGSAIGRKGRDASRVYIAIHPPVGDEVPWSGLRVGQEIRAFPVFSDSNQKMQCPVFDLPSGHMSFGGSCPGAAYCQTITPLEERMRRQVQAQNLGVITEPSRPSPEPNPDAGVSVLESICTQCYACKSNFMYVQNQITNVARLLWTRALIEAGEENRHLWIDTVVEALSHESFRQEQEIDPRTNKRVLPVRIHSSGDFYSQKYAQAWIDVCNQFPQLSFWAPTRTWAAENNWLDRWGPLLDSNRAHNLIVRPSAMHFGDFAPSPNGYYPWAKGAGYMFNAAGSTALYAHGFGRDAAPLEVNGNNYGEYDPRYDWGCQAYHHDKEISKHATCVSAMNPSGQIGCRACWTRPELRICYGAH